MLILMGLLIIYVSHVNQVQFSSGTLQIDFADRVVVNAKSCIDMR